MDLKDKKREDRSIIGCKHLYVYKRGSWESIWIILLIYTICTVIWIPTPPALQLLIYSIGVLYIATHRSLEFFSLPVSIPISTQNTHVDISGETNTHQSLTLTIYEICFFPILASLALPTLYYAFTLDIFVAQIQIILKIYICYLGLDTQKNLFIDIFSIFDSVRESSISTVAHIYNIELWGRERIWKITTLEIFGYMMSSVIIIIYALTEHWMANNSIAFSLAIFAIENVYLGRVLYALFFSLALFLYDVFWVFYTDVMVTVATNIHLPIKLLFKTQNVGNTTNITEFGLLGLGDIVVPGLLLALFLRIDFLTHILTKLRGNQKVENGDLQDLKRATPLNSADFNKSYFHISMYGYLIGIILSQVFGAIFRTPQPALLYLLPATIFPVLLLAMYKGDMGLLIRWDEEFINYELLAGRIGIL